MKAFIILAWTGLLCAGATWALPSGAPTCDSANPTNQFKSKHGNKNTLTLSIAPSTQGYTPGQPMTLTLSGGNVGGVIFGVQDANKKFVSGLSVPAGVSMKMCTNGVGAGMTVTHSALNQVSSVTFPFTPPAGATGPLSVSALVSTGSINTAWGQATLSLAAAGGGRGNSTGNSTVPAGNGKNSPAPVDGAKVSPVAAKPVQPAATKLAATKAAKAVKTTAPKATQAAKNKASCFCLKNNNLKDKIEAKEAEIKAKLGIN
ncbi:hypothetical protein SmJEL517_g06163 [Synchytrium microbalum]|uniref:Uncharacterized protein n=1 Tax=Synchytrium microbalum TaxID=1806994 RepID=A0A507BQZ9_9FUNG|nr:uncharacterized protein SmJEL517_g06163 [Synchytrium microbalum]TPX30222.1 hypothetical protein SmJEL517_g06163 [Synchytrium microbalum]